MYSKGSVQHNNTNVTQIQSSSNSFDTSSALAGMYLWLLFGFFSSLLSCDFQRAVANNMYAKHLIAFITFFFLMTVVDNNNHITIVQTWLKTLLVYILFLMSTKSKLLASLTVFIILVIDQTIKIHIQNVQSKNPIADVRNYQKARQILYILLIVVIVLGYIHYFIRAKKEFGNKFSYTSFVFGTHHCHNINM
jgi:hypothetical protein